MRKLYLFAAMAAMLASCSSDDLTVEKQVAQQNAEEGAVLFDVYTQRTTTRAGEVGCLTTDGFKTGNFKEEGFGVFGYYTNSSTYDQQAIPNFFYNQQVKWESTGSGSFKYEPLKYWPNEYGNTANSDDADKVTYFAYAPWISVNPNTGKPDGEKDPDKLSDLQKWGINSMTTNSTAGDPLIKYIASFDQAKSVDLCWGVCDETNWQKIQDGKAQTFTAGMPWENVERPANTNQRLKFTFKHATAQLKVNIDAFVDGITNATSIDSKTKVYVRAISFEGLATKGSLNLNNREAQPNKAYWMDYNGVNDLPMGETVIVYDGRKDGKEGTLSGEATNEKSLGLNPNLVQSTLWGDASAKPGVTNVPQPLFRNGDVPATEPIYVIPTGDPVKVTITYDIETADKNLSTYVSDAEQHGSSIENVIWKNITFGKDAEGKDINTFENGKSYTLNLHLGMNSVKFDAAVTDWVAQAANDVDLPANIPSYEAKNPAGDAVTAELAYDLTSYQFAITGLEPYETVNVTPSPLPDPVKTATSTAANASGVAIATVTLNANTTVKNKPTASPVEFTGSKNSKKVKLNVTQKAAPLGFSVSSVDFAGKTIHLASSTVNWNSTDIADATKDVTVLKNGIKLTTIIADTPNNTQAKFQTSGSILLSAIEEGDVYSIMIKAGDAAPETFTVTMGYIRFAKETLGLIVAQKGSVTLNHFGDGKVNYAVTGSEASVDSKGIVTGNSIGGSIITATVNDSEHAFYKTKTASYKVVIGNVVIGNNFTPAIVTKAGSTSESVIISGLTPNESVTVEADNAMITGLTGSTDASGRCVVSYNVAAYDSGTINRVAKITVKGATSGTTEITVEQSF